MKIDQLNFRSNVEVLMRQISACLTFLMFYLNEVNFAFPYFPQALRQNVKYFTIFWFYKALINQVSNADLK